MPTARSRLSRSLLVYGGAILLLLLAAVFVRGFSRDVGDARVAGRFSLLPLFRSRIPEELALTWNGLTLHFAHSATPAIEGFESVGSSTDIVFDGDARLRVTPGADTGGSISITPVSGDGPAATASTPADASSVVVPFTVEGVLMSPPDGAALAWRRAGRTYVLTLPAKGRADSTAGTLTLPLDSAARTVLQVQGVTAQAATVAARVQAPAVRQGRPPEEAAMPTEEQLTVALSRYMDVAYKGWSTSRYSIADGTWALADGTSGFSEDIGEGLLAESVARGTWQEVFPAWSDALARQQKAAMASQLLLSSSAYVGGIQDFSRGLQIRSAAQVAQVATALAQSDAAALRTADLVPLLLDHGSPDLLQSAAQLLASTPPGKLDPASAVSYAGNLMDYLRLVKPDDSIYRQLKDAVEKLILPAARAVDNGVFLDTRGGTSDVLTDVLAGVLLIKAGTVLQSSMASAVGRGLLASSLSLADERGFLPASVSVSGGRISGQTGKLGPESFYGKLPAARFFPRETPLAPSLGTGGWVWTSARVASASGSSSGATLVFAYPRGVPYHLVVRGLRPFSLLKLHGIPWHADPTYFKYSDGWSYDAASRTLFMKITGRTDQEEIDILY